MKKNAKKKVTPGVLLAALAALVLVAVCAIIVSKVYTKPSVGKVSAVQTKIAAKSTVVKASKPVATTPVVATKPVAPAAPTATTTQVALHGKVTGIDLRECAKVETGSDGRVSHGATHISRNKDGELTVHYRACAHLVWTTPPTATTVASLEGGAK